MDGNDPREYEHLLKINKHDLDNALMEQPDLFARVAREKAMAVSRKDQAKLRVEEVQAMVDLELRESFAKQGTKVTETAVANRVTVDPDVQRAQKDYLDARRDAEIWSGLCEAFVQRSYAIKDLCALHIAGYYGATSAEGEHRRAATDRLAEKGREGSYTAMAARKARGDDS